MIRSGVRLDQTASDQCRRIEKGREHAGFVRENFAAGTSPFYEGDVPGSLSARAEFFSADQPWHE